jgi:hypothetical protein
MALTGTLKIVCNMTQTNPLDLVTGSAPMQYSKSITYTDGTGAGSVNQMFTDQRTLSASANEDLDLAGSLTNAYGATITATKLKGIIVEAATTNTNNVIVSRPASNGVPLFDAGSDAISLGPGEWFAFGSPTAAGKTVTASTGDLLNFANSAGSTSVTYKVIFLLCTA